MGIVGGICSKVMIFVHARNATGRIAAILKEMANNKGHSKIFVPENSAGYGLALKSVFFIASDGGGLLETLTF